MSGNVLNLPAHVGAPRDKYIRWDSRLNFKQRLRCFTYPSPNF